MMTVLMAFVAVFVTLLSYSTGPTAAASSPHILAEEEGDDKPIVVGGASSGAQQKQQQQPRRNIRMSKEMAQIDINSIMRPGTMELDEDRIKGLLEKNLISSVFNSPSASDHGNGLHPVPTADQWRRWNEQLYRLSRKYGDGSPILFGLDTIHGANYVFNATLFPQPIAIAASFNYSVSYEGGRIGGIETRYAGVPWAFSPVLGLAVQPSWARVFETFGEDPLLVMHMGGAMIRGLQEKPDPDFMLPKSAQHNVAACAKHFVGYTNVRTGHDRTPVSIPMNELLQYYLQPFVNAIVNASVLSIMENYIELNGKPVVSSGLLLKFLLRNQLKFEGLLVTDYNEVFNLKDFHKAVGSYEEALEESLNATTIDMVMTGNYTKYPLVADAVEMLIQGEKLSRERVRESSKRVVEMKEKLGLFEGSPVPHPKKCMFACDSHREAAKDAVRQSVTLLQNNDTFLPLKWEKENESSHSATKRRTSLALIGQACDSVPLMAGGWSVHWQGSSNKSAFPYGASLLEALQTEKEKVTKESDPTSYLSHIDDIMFEEGCNVTEGSVCGEPHVTRALQLASEADVVLMCVGERHYAEKPGDITNMTLPGQQIDLVNHIHSVNKNIVLILVQGRTRLLENLPEISKAIVNAFLPGPSGGEVLTEILLGHTNPSGKMPMTYPKTINNAPIQYWRKYSANTEHDYVVQWPFGHGLSYARFKYHNITATFDPDTAEYVVRVVLQNAGEMTGAEVVMVYSTQKYRRITPEVQMLRGFEKIVLRHGEVRTVQFRIFFADLSYFDEYNCRTFENNPGEFTTAEGLSIALPRLPLPQKLKLQGCMGGKHLSGGCTCGAWSQWYLSQSSGNFDFLTPNKRVHEDSGHTGSNHDTTPDYLVSSIVCFGAGIVGTVIFVTWRRHQRSKQEQQDRKENHRIQLEALQQQHQPRMDTPPSSSGDEEARVTPPGSSSTNRVIGTTTSSASDNVAAAAGRPSLSSNNGGIQPNTIQQPLLAQQQQQPQRGFSNQQPRNTTTTSVPLKYQSQHQQRGGATRSPRRMHGDDEQDDISYYGT